MARIAVLGALLLIGISVYTLTDTLSGVSSATTKVVPDENDDAKQVVVVEIEETATRPEVASLFGAALGWSERERDAFAGVYAQIAWAEWNDELVAIFREQYSLDDEELARFTEHATTYLKPRYDLLSKVTATGSYEVARGVTNAELGALLTERTNKAAGSDALSYIEARLDEEAVGRVLALARGERELLPDLVPLPPRDLYVKDSNEGLLLAFSTTYYNQGEGPLEFRADPATINVLGDVPREVSQLIQKEDGSVREREAGVFLWHHEHIHYHFADFVLYELKRIGDEMIDTVALEHALAADDAETLEQKSTFCVRDVSIVDLELPHRDEEATFQICGRERQGISVGWGDTYFHTYPDQNLNVSDLESGTYQLSFLVNPENRFEEISRENNWSAARFFFDADEKTIELISEYPEHMPTVEHIYEE